MALDPRTPVLVGAAALTQREEDPERALEPLALMQAAAQQAARDAGSRALATRLDSVRVPKGTWTYTNPGRWLADALGAPKARTLQANLGVLQTTLLGGAARDVLAGKADVVLIVGGECTYRERRARRAGREASVREGEVAPPDEALEPQGHIVSRAEIDARLLSAVSQYALIENALRRAEGVDLETHRRRIADLWVHVARAAADNPGAWNPTGLKPRDLDDGVDGNRTLALPYTKLHCSQMNVDQAAALWLCSVETARSLGIARDKWVFPWAVTESNYMLPLTERRGLHQAPGFALAGERIVARSGIALEAISHLELYSCFPCAVEVQLQELGIERSRPLSVTGGMAAAGGPLNNFVLQAQARMLEVLRAQPGSTGLVTAISGLLTKQGMALASTEPGPEAFAYDEVGDATAARIEPVEVHADGRGRGRVASYTVLHDTPQPRTVLVVDLESGGRVVRSDADPELAAIASREDLCGRAVRVAEDLSLE